LLETVALILTLLFGLARNAKGQFMAAPIYSDVTILNKFETTPYIVYESKDLFPFVAITEGRVFVPAGVDAERLPILIQTQYRNI